MTANTGQDGRELLEAASEVPIRPYVSTFPLGATAEGKKELIALVDGQRESEASWTAVPLDLKDRGMTVAPKLATGDGSLGFWLAMSKVFPSTRQQRCWVHKTANVLDKLPRNHQP